MSKQSLKDKTMEIKIYAPVLITTLNRYEHFKRCLESLEKCSGADKTDVYVALDYPPSDKYVEGWKKIDEYLHRKEVDNGFQHLNVIRRDHNYGISEFVSSNYGRLLYDEIYDKYEAFISTEDDNIFSPNFLEYINQGLEAYKDDENCVGVCGHNFVDFNIQNYSSNIYLSHEYSAWGVGTWSSKNKYLNEYLTLEYAKSIMNSWKKIWVLYKHEPRILNTVLLNLAINRAFGDTMTVCYQYLENKYSVFPTYSKVKNIGFDGSGTSIFTNDDIHENQPIDQGKTFCMDNVDRIVYPDVQKQIENLKWFKRSRLLNIVIFIRVLLYYFLKIDILYFEQKRRNKNLF